MICEICRRNHEKRMPSRTSRGMLKVYTNIESMNIDDNNLLVNIANETDDTSKADTIVQCSLISPETITISVRISTASHNFCIICRSNPDGKHATVIFESIRLTLLVEHTVYSKPDVGCCKNHLNGNHLEPEGLIMVKKNYPPIRFIMSDVLMDIIQESPKL